MNHIPLLFLTLEHVLGRPLLASAELETKPGSDGKAKPRENESTDEIAIDTAAFACEKAAKVRGEKKSEQQGKPSAVSDEERAQLIRFFRLKARGVTRNPAYAVPRHWRTCSWAKLTWNTNQGHYKHVSLRKSFHLS